MIWRVRDESTELEHVERNGDLVHDWLPSSGNTIELLVRELGAEVDQRVDVTVDWEPTFTAHLKSPA